MNIELELLEMEDPTFGAGVSKTAKARLTNPTAKQFVYDVELYLGVNKLVTSGVGSIVIPAGGSLNVSFTIVMPAVEANYPVFLDVLESGVLIAHYQATENVTIVISPVITVGPITWE